MQKAFLVSALMFAVALAGCADDPPSGEFVATNSAADYSVLSVVIDATPASNNYPANDPSGGAQECGLDGVTGMIPVPTFSCQGAESTVSMLPAGGVTLPVVPDSPGYSVFVMRGDQEQGVGKFEHHGAGHFAFTTTTFVDQDFSDATAVELRLGEAVIARANGGGGAFALSTELEMVKADVSYAGKDITVTMSDAPVGVLFTAWLVAIDDETGVKTHEEQFALGDNETVFQAMQNVGKYNEFHIHVGSSSINIAVATIE